MEKNSSALNVKKNLNLVYKETKKAVYQLIYREIFLIYREIFSVYKTLFSFLMGPRNNNISTINFFIIKFKWICTLCSYKLNIKDWELFIFIIYLNNIIPNSNLRFKIFFFKLQGLFIGIYISANWSNYVSIRAILTIKINLTNLNN